MYFIFKPAQLRSILNLFTITNIKQLILIAVHNFDGGGIKEYLGLT